MGLSFNRLSGRINRLRKACPKSMFLLIWMMILAPVIMAALPGCDGSSSSASLPVTDLAADNVRRLNIDIGFGLIKWSPGDNMLFYKSGDWVYAARADGTGTDKLVQVSSKDIFSPDEGKLLYTKTVTLQTGEDITWQVYEMSLENSQSQKIGELDITDYDSKAWSPDGTRIFYTTRAGDKDEAFIWDIYANKTRSICTLPREPAGFSIKSRPLWSPDGKYIAWYQLVNSKRESEGIIPGDTFIILIDIEKGEYAELAQIDGEPYSQISWSPDSKRLMYAESVLQPDPYQTSLWAVDIRGNKQQVASMPDKHVCGFYGPDKGKITLISYDPACMRVLRNATFRAAAPEDRTQISILDTDGTEEQRLLDIPCTEGVVLPEVCSWSNDGVSLAFVCVVNSEPHYTDIYVLDVPSGS